MEEFDINKSKKATKDDNDVLERIVVNAMNIISGKQAPKVEAMLSSGQSQGEGLSTAITFVLQAVVGGLQKKGVEISPGLILSENGAASQIAQLLVVLIGASGQDITPDEIQEALSVGIDNFGRKQRMQGQPPEQPPAAPQQPPQQQPTGVPPRTPPQPQPGILSGAGR